MTVLLCTWNWQVRKVRLVSAANPLSLWPDKWLGPNLRFKNLMSKDYYYYYYYYYYYLLELSFHSVAIVLTLVQAKQIRINIHKRSNSVKTIQKTVNTSTHITKTPTQLSKQSHITKPIHSHTHTLENKWKQPQHKIHTKWNSNNTVQ
jgi:hypothetical protein